jgi:tripartite-type tricarboxylate transporter receptor subunit TctC
MQGSKHYAGWFRRIVLFIGTAGFAAAVSAQGQSAPSSKPITIVVPYATGGGVDFYARLLAQELTQHLGQNVIVENRPGGGGHIGADYVAKSAPDGRTFMLNTNAYVISAVLYKKLNYDAVNDLVPVTTLGDAPLVIAVTAGLPVRDLAELVALSRTKGSKIAYGSCGTGTNQHLGGELFKAMTGADILHVPYKGCGPAAVDLAGGQVQVAITSFAATVPYVKASKVRNLSNTMTKRSKVAPDLPSAAEAGVPGYDVNQWYGLFAPAKTPREVIARVNAGVAKAVANEEMVKKLLVGGIEPAHGTPEEFRQVVRDDFQRWGKLVKDMNISLE